MRGHTGVTKRNFHAVKSLLAHELICVTSNVKESETVLFCVFGHDEVSKFDLDVRGNVRVSDFTLAKMTFT